MAVEKLSITKIEAGMIHVRPLVQSWCENCSANIGCGMGLLQQMRSKSSDRHDGLKIPVRNDGQSLLSAGDTVEVSLADYQLIKFSFLLYLLPLASMLVATIAIQQITIALGLAESWIILGALLALVSGFLFARYFSLQLPVIPEVTGTAKALSRDSLAKNA